MGNGDITSVNGDMGVSLWSPSSSTSSSTKWAKTLFGESLSLQLLTKTKSWSEVLKHCVLSM